MVLEVLKDKEHETGGCGSGGCGGEGERCGNGLEKIYPTIVVRFGYMKYIGEFTHAPEMKFSCGAKVVAQTHRGIELGEQVSLTCNGCSKCLTREQIKSYIAESGAEDYHFANGRILREATRADLMEHARITHASRVKLRTCRDLVAKHGLPMKPVECEHLLGGERIVIYFMSDKRVDFRNLVKDLGAEFNTRIEMRQVGARDEARLVADYETCGQECCCKVFLKNLKPVSMKMAKMQKATLDPSKVSGRCGRLKCCLRYEHTSYEELDRTLPKMGERIRTAHGNGVVVNRQILTQLVEIEMEDQKRITVTVEDVLGANEAAPPGRADAVVDHPGLQPRAESSSDAGPEDIKETVEDDPGAPSDPKSRTRGRRWRRREPGDDPGGMNPGR